MFQPIFQVQLLQHLSLQNALSIKVESVFFHIKIHALTLSYLIVNKLQQMPLENTQIPSCFLGTRIPVAHNRSLKDPQRLSKVDLSTQFGGMHISDKLLESFATGWVFTKIRNDLPQAIIHSLSICFRIPTIEICKLEECWCVVHQILRCEFGHAFQTAFTRSQIERRAVMEMLRVQVTCFLDNSANATTSFVIAPDIFSKDRHLGSPKLDGLAFCKYCALTRHYRL